MQITNEHVDHRVMYTDRKGVQTYGTIRSIANNFVDIEREEGSKRTFYVPIDNLLLVDEDGVPLIG